VNVELREDALHASSICLLLRFEKYMNFFDAGSLEKHDAGILVQPVVAKHLFRLIAQVLLLSADPTRVLTFETWFQVAYNLCI